MPTGSARHCPICDSPVPANFLEGMCPRCLLAGSAPWVEGEETLPYEGTPPSKPPSQRYPRPGVPTLETLRGLFPDLEILDLVGAGGMGAVYKARQSRLNRLVALKVMVAPPGREADFALRFEREAQLLARLNHPHIVTLYDFGEFPAERTGDAPLFWFLMEFVDGTDLGYLIRSKELKPAEALAIVPQICEALQYAHDQGITHRDIKPANLLIDRRGVVKIADFGLAKMIGGAEEALMTGLTQSGWSMGTPHYMAPEQWENPEQVDHRVDIYALGVVFYEMLTGERPAGVFEPPSRKSSPPVDKKLDGVVMRAMDKDPERRYQQAGQIGDEVTQITGANRRPPTAPAAGKRGRTKPLLTVGALALLATGAWRMWNQEEAPLPAKEPVSGAQGSVPWVSLYQTEAELKPLFRTPTSLYPELSSHTELVRDPSSGLRLVDGWLTPTTTYVKLRMPSGRNTGVRMRVRMKEPERMDGASIWLRGVDGGPIYSGHWRGLTKYSGNKETVPEELAFRSHLVAKKPGETFTLEFYAVGPHLICRYEGDEIRHVETGPSDHTGSQNHLMIRSPVTDIEFINLDGLSEVEALCLVESGKSAPPSPGTAKPGRLRAVGTMLNGRPPDLAKFAAYDDFVDVAASYEMCVALRANGETISSDGRADFAGIRKIGRSYPQGGYPCFIDDSGGLRFHPLLEMSAPTGLEGRVVADAACGSHHGVALLEDGQAVVFGKRYEEEVGDLSQAQGNGTPRWPQPEAAALQNVKGVAVTQTHAATLHHDGTVSVWGYEGPVKWQPEPEMKPVRQISSFHDALHLLDEAGQVWNFPLPRSAHPEQPVGFNGKPRLLGKGAVRLRDHLWLDAKGIWRAVEADLPTVKALESVRLQPETHFTLAASISGPRPYGYVLWIEPDAGSAVDTPTQPGRLRTACTTADGRPHDLSKFDAYDDFVDVAGGWRRWVALRANGQTIPSDGRADFTGIAKIAASFDAEYAFITAKGKLVIPDYEVWTLPAELEQGVVDAAGQLRRLPVPRNPAPGQPVKVTDSQPWLKPPSPGWASAAGAASADSGLRTWSPMEPGC